MAEIKSTLDLVMEKTKNLSLSDEERQGQKNKEIESRICGLLQKFNDQALNIDNLRSEFHPPDFFIGKRLNNPAFKNSRLKRAM